MDPSIQVELVAENTVTGFMAEMYIYDSNRFQ